MEEIYIVEEKNPNEDWIIVSICKTLELAEKKKKFHKEYALYDEAEHRIRKEYLITK